MPLDQQVKICTHVKVTGHPCGSPALRGERFCYFHQRMIRGVRTPPKSRIHPIALIENEEGIQVALMETINAIVRNTIDLPRANLILRALNIAVRNSRRVRFDRLESEMVRAIPEYPHAAPSQSVENESKIENGKDHKAREKEKEKEDVAPEVASPRPGKISTAVTNAVGTRKPPSRVPGSTVVARAQAASARPLRE